MLFLKRVLHLLILLILLPFLLNAFVILSQRGDVVSPSYTGKNTGLVLGASVKADGTLSPVLKERVDASIQAYKDGLIDRILVSGYDQDEMHLEAVSMSDYLLDKGIQDADIIVDSGGYDTLASMERAKDEFQLEEIIVFTQRYHLWRSLLLADVIGLDAVGYAADPHELRKEDFGTTREFFARVKAVLEVILKITGAL